MAKLDRTSTDVTEGKEEQHALSKTEPQPELDKTLEQLTKRIAKGGGLTLLGSGYGKLVQFGFYILLGRVLGAGAYGLYALGFSVLQLASQISILGLQNGIVRFVAMYKGEGDLNRVKGTLVSALSIATLTSLVIGILLFLFSDVISITIFNEPQLASVLKIFAVALPFLVLMQMSAHTARGFQRMEYYVGIQNLIWPVSNILLVGLAFILGYRLMGAVYGFLISMVLSGVIGLLLIPKRIFPRGSSVQPNYEVKKLLWFSLPVVFIGFGQYLLSQTDRLMIGYFMIPAGVGIYSAAAVIAMQTAFFVINSVNMVFAPMIADLYNRQNIQELDGLFKMVTRWIVMLTLPWVLIMALFPKPVMGLFGAGFGEGSNVLLALVLAYLVDAATGPVGLILIMSGKQHIELFNALGMAVVNIGLNAWLIQRHGILGAAVATGFSIAIVNITRVIEVYKLIGIQPYNKKYLKSLLVGVLVFLLVKFLTDWSGIGLHWGVGLVIFLLFYLGGHIILGIETEDKMILQAVGQRFAAMMR